MISYLRETRMTELQSVTSLTILDQTTLLAIRHKRTRTALTPATKALRHSNLTRSRL